MATMRDFGNMLNQKLSKKKPNKKSFSPWEKMGKMDLEKHHKMMEKEC